MNFNEIWASNNLPIKNFIASKVPAPEIPDILQNVSIELFKGMQKGLKINNPKAWLFQVTRHTIADHYKQKSKAVESEYNFTSMPSEDFKPCVCDIMEPIIKSVLPPKYSVPLILSDIQKVPQKEIAERLDINYVNTKSRIQRARTKFKKAFEQSVELSYNREGNIVGGKLKAEHNLPIELVQKIKKMQLED